MQNEGSSHPLNGTGKDGIEFLFEASDVVPKNYQQNSQKIPQHCSMEQSFNAEKCSRKCPNNHKREKHLVNVIIRTRILILIKISN